MKVASATPPSMLLPHCAWTSKYAKGPPSRTATNTTYASQPSGASATPASIRACRRGSGPARPAPASPRCSRYPRRRVAAAVIARAAMSAAAVGRVRPASTHSAPATIQRPVRTAYSAQAASAVNRVSVYAIDCTNAVG